MIVRNYKKGFFPFSCPYWFLAIIGVFALFGTASSPYWVSDTYGEDAAVLGLWALRTISHDIPIFFWCLLAFWMPLTVKHFLYFWAESTKEFL